MRAAAILLGLLLPALASAQDPCVFVPGGCPPENIFQTTVVPTIANLFLRLTGGLSIIFIIWACIQMVMSWGDEGKIENARKSMTWSMIAMAVALLSQLLISFVVTEAQNFGLQSPIDYDLNVMAQVVRVMLRAFNIIMGIMIFISGVKMLMARGKMDEFDKARTILAWSIIAGILANISHFAIQIVVTSLLL